MLQQELEGAAGVLQPQPAGASWREEEGCCRRNMTGVCSLQQLPATRHVLPEEQDSDGS